MKKLFTILTLTIIGVFIMSGNSNAQQRLHTSSTTLYRVADATAFGGSSVGFFFTPTSLPGTGSHLQLYYIEIVDCNSTANTVSVYINSTTYALATVQAQNQIVGTVTFANSTTVVTGNHLGLGNGAVVDVLARKGIAYIGERPTTFSFVAPDGTPTEVSGFGLKPTNGVNVFTARITYLRY